MMKKFHKLFLVISTPIVLNAGIISSVEPFMAASVTSINAVISTQLAVDTAATKAIKESLVSKLKANSIKRKDLLNEIMLSNKRNNAQIKQMLFYQKQAVKLQNNNSQTIAERPDE